MTTSAVCTLFEGDYHYGVGALVNSLYHHGFRGVVWSGYRGELPPWAAGAKNLSAGGCGEAELFVAEGCRVHFVPVEAKVHLTNYKPHFMLHLWDIHCPEVEQLFYFDPDITIKCRWSFFEEWARHGVALCQDVNWCMPADHPLRLIWQEVLQCRELLCERTLNVYYNGGFIGLQKNQKQFLQLWRELSNMPSEFGVSLQSFTDQDRTYPFSRQDQDVLNCAAMAWPFSLSTMGPEAMDFAPGGYTMSHAVGAPKPWRKHMFCEALKGKAPSAADKGFVQHACTPIALYSDIMLRFKKFDLRCGAAVGRLGRRS